MVKIKTELEQKIELMDSLRNVKNVVNEAGGSITEDTPYLQYGEKVSEVASGGDSSAFRIIYDLGMCKVDNGVYSVEWQIEKPELQYDEYYSRFTVEQGSNGKYSFIAIDTTKDGQVVGLPHFVGCLTLFTGARSTPFVLPEFDYDTESDVYSAIVEGYSLNFTIETDPEDETSANFVCGTITKDGLEVGNWNLGLWNEELN